MTPVGLIPPLKVAVSLIDPPKAALAEAVVTTVGVACVTTTVSLAPLQVLAVAVLLASPL
jgi:hypothetical protein